MKQMRGTRTEFSQQIVVIDEEQIKELIARLDALIALLSMTLPKETSQMDKIKLLSDAGLVPRDIAKVLGTTPNTVSVALSKLRRGTKKEKLMSVEQRAEAKDEKDTHSEGP
jgi:CRP-like cAMP-binding protein